jgi:exopolyphosphatase/guanosine-5'-triphosphate,3'-diphosphate pyrophosphatase
VSKTTSFRAVLPKFAPIAVVDIGSNSVRLVVYDAMRRAPSPVFNEKILCGLGRGVAASGNLSKQGVERALKALARFGALCEQIGVVDCYPIATAAAREAKNGKEFVANAENALGHKIRVLTGKEEARFAAMGVISSIPEACGVVGDLGGGSLELVDVCNGDIKTGVTLPLGPFRLMDAIAGSDKSARQIVEKALHDSGLLKAMKGRPFYAVGGAWRNLAKLHMQQNNHPLSVLQQYALSDTAARSVAILVGGMDKGELRDVDAIAKKRAETLPLASLVLDRLLTLGEPSQVVFSVYGVREGVLFSKLKKEKRRHDPLLSGCWDFARRYARSPEHENELCDWTDKLFADDFFNEDEARKRLRHAACLMADIGWRASPDYRGSRSLNLITQANIVGIDHPGRVFLALAIYFRYQGITKKAPENMANLIDDDDETRARQLAGILRLAYALTAAMPGMLPQLQLNVKDGKTLRLSLPGSHKNLAGEVVEKRLEQLADLLDCKSHIAIDK